MVVVVVCVCVFMCCCGRIDVCLEVVVVVGVCVCMCVSCGVCVCVCVKRRHVVVASEEVEEEGRRAGLECLPTGPRINLSRDALEFTSERKTRL